MRPGFLYAAGRLRFGRVLPVLIIIVGVLANQASAQSPSVLRGIVTSGGESLPGVQVHLIGTGYGSVTDTNGAFRLEAPAGDYTIEIRFVGFATQHREVRLEPGGARTEDFELIKTTLLMDNVVVTATGERQSRNDIAASIGAINRDVIDRAKPGHPSEIMQRIPGVWVNHTTGEGHMTAIRQPLSTEPVYLYLEDGIPTRSTGFFNHNALYEINIPQAQSVEVLKGPGTALYGSDAIGGVINVTTKPVPDTPGFGLSAEGGAFGFARVLASAGTGFDRGGVNIDMNVTRSDGWRDGTAYDRQSGTLRWDYHLAGGQRLKTVLTVSNVDQAPAGSSALSEADYLEDPTQNYSPISFRRVQAVRLSTEYERVAARSILTVTPYVRYNTNDLLPNWSLSFDPATWETTNYSLGLVAKHRTDFETMRGRVIGGVDLDLSPGERVETKVDAERVDGRFVSYVLSDALYDYDVTFRQASPFVHGEISPATALRVTGGLRLDMLDYVYENNLSVVTEGSHRRAASTSRPFTHLSPKLGATYQVVGNLNVFAAYKHAFRVPSESQLFRQGSTSNTLDLVPVKVNSYEMGLRSRPTSWLSGEVSGYLMNKEDDIVTFTDPDGIRVSTNAGKTRHRGVEVGLSISPSSQVRVDVAGTIAEHTYEDWQPNASQDLSGNKMAVAPQEIANVILTYEAEFLPGTAVSVEWTHLGEYWMDPENTARYDGHDLLNLRINARVRRGVSLFGRINNLTDELYAERATYNAFRGDEFAPGLPRAVYLGLTFSLGGEDV